MKAVDASYHDLTAAQAQALKDAGWKLWIQCLWTGADQPPTRVTNLRAAVNAGLLVAAYISVTRSQTGTWHVNKGRAGVPDDLWGKLLWVAVDVELEGISNAKVRQAVEKVASLGKGRVIYTSYNAWVSYQGNPLDFTDCLLWNANWRNRPPTQVGDYFHSLPYGGWAKAQVIGEQWSGGATVEGAYVDRNEFREVTVPDRIMTEKEALDLNAKFALVFGGARKADDLVAQLKFYYGIKGWPFP